MSKSTRTTRERQQPPSPFSFFWTRPPSESERRRMIFDQRQQQQAERAILAAALFDFDRLAPFASSIRREQFADEQVGRMVLAAIGSARIYGEPDIDALKRMALRWPDSRGIRWLIGCGEELASIIDDNLVRWAVSTLTRKAAA